MRKHREATRNGSLLLPTPRGRTAVVFSGGGTGGHLYPALALADALGHLRPDLRPVFVGARRGIEARVLPERGAEHVLLSVEGFPRGGGLGAHLSVLRQLARALVRTAQVFRNIRPSLVVVTGGYAGGPAGLMAGLMRIPLALQEQNAEPGLVTRVLALWARDIHVAFPEVSSRLPGRARKRVQVSGNPVRPPRDLCRDDAVRGAGLDPARPVVLVVGGSQGSKALNDALLTVVTQLSAQSGSEVGPGFDRASPQLLWSTGPTHQEAVRSRIESAFEGRVPDWIRLEGFIDDMDSALAAADLAVSRAGAMATSEFMARGLPSILIPLPTAAADHQTLNARALEAAGAALCMEEAGLDPAALWAEVQAVLSDESRRAAMAQAASERGRPEAARKTAEQLARYLPPGLPRSPELPTSTGGAA